MTPELVHLGREIRGTRKRKGVSQELLAERAGIDRSHMGRIERGETDIRITTLLAIARALNVTPGVLLGG